MLLFIDESGYTGTHLMDAKQPVFVLSSIGLPEAECRALVSKFFGSVRASELKHSRLSSHRRQRQMVVDFCAYACEVGDLAKLHVELKPYALVCKLVDLLIEPACYENGWDIYADGFGRKCADMLWYCLPAFGAEQDLMSLLACLEATIRDCSRRNWARLMACLFRRRISLNVDKCLEVVRTSVLQTGYEGFRQRNMGGRELDLALTSLLSIVGEWRRDTDERIEVVHDASSNLARQRELWDALAAPAQPKAVIGYHYQTMQFPLGVTRTSLECSGKWSGLQLADVLAGAAARWLAWRYRGCPKQDGYAVALHEVLEELPISGVWPGTSQALDSNVQHPHGITDPIQYIAEALRQAERE